MNEPLDKDYVACTGRILLEVGMQQCAAAAAAASASRRSDENRLALHLRPYPCQFGQDGQIINLYGNVMPGASSNSTRLVNNFVRT